MPSTTLRASDLATFEFCHRAWHYARLDTHHENPEQLKEGADWHEAMEHRSRASKILLRLGAYLAALGIATAIVGILFR